MVESRAENSVLAVTAPLLAYILDMRVGVLPAKETKNNINSEADEYTDADFVNYDLQNRLFDL